MQQIFVTIENVSKTFPGQRALDEVSFDIRHGEVHALLGHNGSGKSTLIKVLAGFHTPDPGSAVSILGNRLEFGSPQRSFAAGLRFVHQDLALIDELTVLENMSLSTGYARTASRMIDWGAQRRRATALLEALDAHVDLDAPLSELAAIDRSIVAIARALDGLDGSGSLLVLDEPTAALPPDEVERLFKVVRNLRAMGVSCLYVTHRMDEVHDLTDRLTVLRDGRVRASGDTADFDDEQLVDLILGDSRPDPARSERRRPPRRSGPPLLEVRNLRSASIDGIDLEVSAGEIVGIAGVMGSGRESVGPALVGALPADADRFSTVRGTVDRIDPRTTRARGVVLVPGTRGPGSMIDDFSVTENLTFPMLGRYQRWGFLKPSAELEVVRDWIDRFALRPPRPGAALRELSGGNKQKVLVAKWMNTDPSVLIMDEPTAGVDVGASAAIHQFIREVAAEGLACVVSSSDLEDLIAVAARVLIMDHGRVVATLIGDEITEQNILLGMSSSHASEAAPSRTPAPA